MPPYNGSGTFTPYVPGNPVVTGTVISSTAFNATQQDIAAGLSNAMTRDGQSPPSANIPMAGKKFTGLAAGIVAGDSLRWEQLFSQGVEQDIVSAATTDIGALNTAVVRITGTTTITSFGTNYNGPRYVRFAGALLLTHNASTLILPTGSNITTTAGDRAILVPVGSPGSGWQVVAYQRGDGVSAPENQIINGNFSVNQLAVSGSVVLAAGAYGHDGWKAGAAGCTYTFATSNNLTTVTISAGSLIQVVEGLNLQSSNYTLSWVGTAQGKIGAGGYAASPVTGAATGGTNLNVEFNTGTLSRVRLEIGGIANTFQLRPYQQELALCKRFFHVFSDSDLRLSSYGGAAAPALVNFTLPVAMRATPTVTQPGSFNNSNIGGTTLSAASANIVRVAGTVTALGAFSFENSGTPATASARL